MKKIGFYIPNVLLTFLLVFFLLAAEMLGFVKTQVLRPENFRTVAQQEALADKAYTSLEAYFNTRHNSTGIPAQVFMDPMDREALAEGITDSVTQAFDYLNGKTAEYNFTMDLTEMDASVDKFFSDYAAENGVAKDETYEKKLASVKAEAESEIRFVTDTFKFSVMAENGWLSKARAYMGYLDMGTAAVLGVLAVLLVLLFLCNFRQKAHLLYWTGLSLSIGAVLALIPCIYVTAADYFSGFAIKDPQVFAAVVGFLDLLTVRLMVFEGILLGTGLLFLVLFGILRRTAAGVHPPNAPTGQRSGRVS